MSWTDDRIDQLKKLWAAGLTCSEIAGELGGVSRNAVIGKVHRLGLGRVHVNSNAEKKTSEPKPGQRRPTMARIPMRPKAESPPIAAEPNEDAAPEIDDIAPATLVQFLDLTDETCKWPVGDVQAPNFGFCGRPPLAGTPYCAGHRRISLNPLHVTRARRGR